jgi:hypothetical protein
MPLVTYEDFEKEYFVFCESCGFYFLKREAEGFGQAFGERFSYRNGKLVSCPWCHFDEEEIIYVGR